jgi:hypothetical protein
MKKLILLLMLLISSNANAQFLKDVYKDFLKYGTFYAAGNIGNAYDTQEPSYFIRTDPDNLYAIPTVLDNTVHHPFDYRYGIGIRKLARFDYEVKPGNFWTGNDEIEKQTALSAPTSAVKGFEYLVHYEKERKRGEEFTNSRFFLRHTGKYHIAKVEQRSQGNVNFKYKSAEVRGRLPIGKKFSISAGAIYRTHERPYGYNPVEIWLNETNEWGNAVNPWYTLGHEYGYSDHYTSYSMDGLPTVYDWIWMDSDNNVVAYGDKDFRDRVMPGLLNRYNNEIWDTLPSYGEVAPIIGADFYHYKNKFWLHAYGNYLLPAHKYLKGKNEFSYLHRDCWGVGGHVEDCKEAQWDDYQVGLVFGWKIGKSLGVFVEGEYMKFWDSQIYNTNFGINFTFK